MIHIHKYKLTRWEIYWNERMVELYGYWDRLYLECRFCGKTKEKIIEHSKVKISKYK